MSLPPHSTSPFTPKHTDQLLAFKKDIYPVMLGSIWNLYFVILMEAEDCNWHFFLIFSVCQTVKTSCSNVSTSSSNLSTTRGSKLSNSSISSSNKTTLLKMGECGGITELLLMKRWTTFNACNSMLVWECVCVSIETAEQYKAEQASSAVSKRALICN